jgi:hypothetical protein
MNWFAAHLVFWVKLKEQPQKHFPVWENIILLQAASEEHAWHKARAHGRVEAGDGDGTFRWGGEPRPVSSRAFAS